MIKEIYADMTVTDGMCVAERAVKRMVDTLLSFAGLVCLSPAFLIVYIMLKRQADGPVIFRQERIGYKGEPFYILKFRTMRVDSEENGTPQLARKEDDRLTPVGKFLREHHLDELPQLFNVLKGDMSFVGPRPERKYFIDKIMQVNPDYEYIYQMRPGLTSMAIVSCNLPSAMLLRIGAANLYMMSHQYARSALFSATCWRSRSQAAIRNVAVLTVLPSFTLPSFFTSFLIFVQSSSALA